MSFLREAARAHLIRSAETFDAGKDDPQKGVELLVQSARSGCEEACLILLSKGVDPDGSDPRRRTALHIAVASDRRGIVDVLLARGGADLDAQDDDGQTALHLAVKQRSARVCTSLLERGANVRVFDSKKRTPLHLAAELGFGDVCELLLSEKGGADPNEKNADECTPLHAAARNGRAGVCRLLMCKGARIEYDVDAFSPLTFAICESDLQVCRVLLDGEPEAASRPDEDDGLTPLHEAAIFDQKGLEICTLLLDRGAAVQARKRDGQTPLHVAARNGKAEMCALLLDRGAEFTLDGNGKSPLSVARDPKTVRVLLTREGWDNVPTRFEPGFADTLPASSRAMIAQKMPHLLPERLASRVRAVSELIVWIHTAFPRRTRLEVCDLSAQMFFGDGGEPADVIALFCSRAQLRRTRSAPPPPKGLAVREAFRREAAPVARFLPARAWNLILVFAYGIPEAWLGARFWESRPEPCEGPLFLVP